jgi:hypothetical protein
VLLVDLTASRAGKKVASRSWRVGSLYMGRAGRIWSYRRHAVSSRIGLLASPEESHCFSNAGRVSSILGRLGTLQIKYNNVSYRCSDISFTT